MAHKKFGGHIDRAPADVLFNRYIEIKKRSNQKIRECLAGDDEAIRFYCGKATMGLNDDLAYIFDAASLTPVISRILSGEANAIIVFNGARAREDSVDDNGNIIDEDGRPTVLLFPCKFKAGNPEQRSEDEFENVLTDGEEHPGTGGSVGTPLLARGFVRLPEKFLRSEVQDALSKSAT